jgi:hypothetical protein
METLEGSCPHLGDADVHRAIVAAQGRYFDPPLTIHDTRTGHYGRRRKVG